MHRESGEHFKKSTGESLKNPVEKLSRNCRFLSLVVVERVLSFFVIKPSAKLSAIL